MVTATESSAESFKQRFSTNRPADLGLAEQVIEWATNKRLIRRWHTAGEIDTLTCKATVGLESHKVLVLGTDGLVWILFNQLLSRFPSSDVAVKERFHKQLAQRLGKIAGGNTLPTAYKSKASWRLSDMDLPAFLGVTDWILSELRTSHANAVALHAANRARH